MAEMPGTVCIIRVRENSRSERNYHSKELFMGEYGNIIQIGDCLVSGEVVTEFFAGDYDKCKGQCCVVGDCGAPLKEAEAEELERYYDAYSPLMTEHGRKAAQANGFFQIDRDGDMVTPVVSEPHRVDGLDCIVGTDGTVGLPGLEDCAYIHYEKGADGRAMCLCAIERCFFQGKCKFRKPISCSLYPIRVTRLGNGTDALNLHRWTICADAFEKGRREGIRVYQFLKEPLVQAYGQEFYDALDAAAKYLTE